MKKIALIAALGLMGMGSAIAQSTVDGNFNVTVTLTSKCEVTTSGAATAGSGAPALAFGTYNAFATSDSTTTVDIAFKCTRGLPGPTVAFDAAGGGNTGVISGLRYDLTVAAAPSGNATGDEPVLGTPTDLGSANTRNYRISGTMPQGQAGTYSVGAQSQARVLTLTY